MMGVQTVRHGARARERLTARVLPTFVSRRFAKRL